MIAKRNGCVRRLLALAVSAALCLSMTMLAGAAAQVSYTETEYKTVQKTYQKVYGSGVISEVHDKTVTVTYQPGGNTVTVNADDNTSSTTTGTDIGTVQNSSRVRSADTYTLSMPIQKAERIGKNLVVFYVPEGTVVKYASQGENFEDGESQGDYTDNVAGWYVTDRPLSETELQAFAAAGNYEGYQDDWLSAYDGYEDQVLTVKKGGYYELCHQTVDHSITLYSGGVIFCAV